MAKKSQVRIEYEKELKRVQGIVKRGIKKGITFTESPIPETPKRVTRKRVEELKELTYREIWSKGYQIDTETGEVEQYSPYEASKKSHKQAYQTLKTRRREEDERLMRESENYGYKQFDITYWTEDERKNYDELQKDLDEFERVEEEKEKPQPIEVEKPYNPLKDYEGDIESDYEEDEWYDNSEDITPLEHVTTDGKTYAIDPDTGEVVDEVPLQRDELLHYFEEAISGGTNPATSALVYEIYKAEIDEVGEDEVAKRIANSTHEIRTLAEEVAHAYYSDVIRENAVALLNIITAGNYSPWTLERLDETTYQDRPHKHRQSSNRSFYHIAKHVKGLDGDDD